MNRNHEIQNEASWHRCDLISTCFIRRDRPDVQTESLVRIEYVTTSLAAVVKVVLGKRVKVVVSVVLVVVLLAMPSS